MKETELRKKAVAKLNHYGFIFWFPPRLQKFRYDIFGVFDLIAIKGNLIEFIQITTKPNLSARRKKIKEFLQLNNFLCRSFIWAWNDKILDFEIEEINV